MAKKIEVEENKFNNALFGDIKEAKKNATVYDDTQTVIIEPVWTKEVTQDSLRKHIDFIHRQNTITAAATSDIAFEKYPTLKVESWKGCTDLGSATITARTNIIERYKIDDKTTEYDHGIIDTTIDLKIQPEITDFLSQFSELDHERCKGLFDTPVGVSEEEQAEA